MSAPATATGVAADPQRDEFRRLVARKLRHVARSRSTALADEYAEQIDRAVQAYIAERVGGER